MTIEASDALKTILLRHSPILKHREEDANIPWCNHCEIIWPCESYDRTALVYAALTIIRKHESE